MGIKLSVGDYLDDLGKKIKKENSLEDYKVLRIKKNIPGKKDEHYLLLQDIKEPAKYTRIDVSGGKVLMSSSDLESLQILDNVLSKNKPKVFKKSIYNQLVDGVDSLQGQLSSGNLEEHYVQQLQEDLESRGYSSSGGLRPTVGFIFDGHGVHPVYGLTVGDGYGFLITYDPLDRDMKFGGVISLTRDNAIGNFLKRDVRDVGAEVGNAFSNASREIEIVGNALYGKVSDAVGDVSRSMGEMIKGLFDGKNDDDDAAAAIGLLIGAVAVGGVVAYAAGRGVYRTVKNFIEGPKYEIYRLDLDGDKVSKTLVGKYSAK